jgi:hypothetical protein
MLLNWGGPVGVVVVAVVADVVTDPLLVVTTVCTMVDAAVEVLTGTDETDTWVTLTV